MPVKAYFDTCIISGLAKGDIVEAETSALLRILRERHTTKVDLITSAVTNTEISKIPAQHRTPHTAIYALLGEIPSALTHKTCSGLMLRGVGGGRREDPLFTALKSILPDAMDAEHVFQAAKNEVSFFITVDRRTILNHAAAVERLCGVQLLSPTEFEQRAPWEPEAERR